MNTFSFLRMICRLTLVGMMALVYCSTSMIAQTKFVEKKAGHIFYLSVPEYMQATRDLNDNASLQFKNGRKEAYIIVIEDSKEILHEAGASFENLKEFTEQMSKSFSEKLTRATRSKPTTFTTKSGDKGMMVEIMGKSDDVDAAYLCGYIETKGYWYQVICWTLQDKKKELFPEYQKIVQSLRE